MRSGNTILKGRNGPKESSITSWNNQIFSIDYWFKYTDYVYW